MKIQWSKTDSMSRSDLLILLLLIVSLVIYLFSEYLKRLLSIVLALAGGIGEAFVELIGSLFTWKVLVVILLYLMLRELVKIRNLLLFNARDKES